MLELMVVMAIIGIISSFAIPSYQQYIMRGELVSTTTTLSTLATQMEKTYLDNFRRYGSDSACTLAMPVSAQNKFSYACKTTDNAGQNFVITATSNQAAGTYAQNKFVYTLDNNGVQQTTKFNGVEKNKSCWIRDQQDNCF